MIRIPRSAANNARRRRTRRNDNEPPIPTMIVFTPKEMTPKKHRHWPVVEDSDDSDSDGDGDCYVGGFTKPDVAITPPSLRKAVPVKQTTTERIQRYPMAALSRLESVHKIDLDDFGQDCGDRNVLMADDDDLCDVNEFAGGCGGGDGGDRHMAVVEVTETTSVEEASDHTATQPRAQSSHRPPDYVMEIVPGVYRTLRGARYTQDALDDGRCVETMCLLCDIRLACVDDCQGVVCPRCFSLSPVPGHDGDDSPHGGGGYVGIGLQLV